MVRLESQESGNKRLDLFIDGGEAVGTIAADQSASQLAFRTAGSERLRVDASGNVGINETSPYYKLHLKTNNNATSLSDGTGGNWGSDGIRIENTNATGGSLVLAHFRNYDADWHIGGKYVGANDSDFLFLSESNERLRITSDGKIGVGVAAPAYLAHIHNSGTGSGDHSYLHFTTGDTGATGSDGLTVGVGANQTAYINYRESNPLVISTSGTERVRILSDGKVGVNDTSPASLFTVGEWNMIDNALIYLK